jgi:hypothetical protein
MDLNKDFHDEFKVIGNMTTLDCQVVMLPTEKSNMCHLTGIDNIKEWNIAPNRNAFITNKSHGIILQPFDIYLTTDEPIQEGDWYYNTTDDRIDTTKWAHILTLINQHPKAEKIIASTDPSLGLPGIPESFLERYVAANGNIDTVRLGTGECKCTCLIRSDDCSNRKLKLTEANEVVVVGFGGDLTVNEFMHKLKHEVSSEQRKDWASANKHRIVPDTQDKELEDAAHQYSCMKVEEGTPYTDSLRKHIIKNFKAGAEWQKEQSAIADTDIQASEKVYSEADMYMAIHHVYKATSTDGFFGGNVRFKELYSHFANNKEKILQWHQIKK